MMGNPKVIILDDPVHDMDVDTSKIFWNALLVHILKHLLTKIYVYIAKTQDVYCLIFNLRNTKKEEQ